MFNLRLIFDLIFLFEFVIFILEKVKRKKTMSDLIPQAGSIVNEIIENKILLIRGYKVMLDKDLAELYGVKTKVLNQAVKRNIKRFPFDFMLKLTKEEKDEVVTICDHLKVLKFSPQLPYAFTEQGVAMLSTVLNSERAIKVNIGIMRVFVNIRKLVSSNKIILNKLNQLEEEVKSHDKKIRTIFEIIHKPLDTKLLSPGKPFSNKKVIRDIISSCEKYIYWIDKYFSKVGLDLLADSLNVDKVKNVKLLMLSEKVDKKFKDLFEDLKEELKGKDVKCELKIITDNKLKAEIHDRWIISENVCFNTPSTDTVARGQYSEVKKTTNKPPFDEWWKKSEET